MAFVESFTPMFADFGTAGFLAGGGVTGIMDVETFEEGPGALTQRLSYLLQPGHGLTPAAGQSLVVGATTYTVRQVIMEPPDGAMLRLVLARA